jgi:DDE family transposase
LIQEVILMVHELAAVVFDDQRVVANAGVMLPAVLAGRLGIEELVDETVCLGERSGAARPGRKVMSLVSAMVLGADCIDDCDILRSGQTTTVLGHEVVAPLVIDVDSFVSEVFGPAKQGVGFGYTRVRGYHPLLATRADTGEVLHIRLRTGSANTSRGMPRFLDELVARVDRADAKGPKLLRADSGFWSNHTFDRLDQAGWAFSIGIRLNPFVRAAIEQIDETAWRTLADYPATSIAQIAETTYGGRRLVVRRVRTLDRQGQLLPTWELFPFLTNRDDDLFTVEAEHRQHAVVEQTIRDLKDQALAHFPSGRFFANAAWTVIAALAHNLIRWTQTLAIGGTVRTARTLRRRLLTIPGRLVRTARKLTLRMPARWPWADTFLDALARLRAIPPPA